MVIVSRLLDRFAWRVVFDSTRAGIMNKREQREQELLDIKNAYLAAYAAFHGQEAADKTRVWYEYGWFYVVAAWKDKIGWMFSERPLVVRDFQLREITDRLRRIKAGLEQ